LADGRPAPRAARPAARRHAHERYQTIAVTGAGLSGLSCARALADAGARAELFDESPQRFEAHVPGAARRDRINAQYGDAPQMKLRLAALRLPRETMLRAFGWAPEIHGY
jgi:2-polyprenyl-6-methoxyphenol hydroxylase-like FAD-dependent oxidoreductase